jgi:hypothetical protein
MLASEIVFFFVNEVFGFSIFVMMALMLKDLP